MIIQLSKNVRFIGVCVETEIARTIRAQTAPVGWLIPSGVFYGSNKVQDTPRLVSFLEFNSNFPVTFPDLFMWE